MHIFWILACSVSATYYNGYEDMLKQVNAVRAEKGLPALCNNEDLMKSSLDHSNYQASIRKMTHGGPPPFKERFAPLKPTKMAENVADTGSLDIANVMRLWINSSGHYANIIGDYTHFGSAVVQVGGRYFWTQQFANSKAPCMSGGAGSGAPAPSAPSAPAAPASSAPAAAGPASGPNSSSAPQTAPADPSANALAPNEIKDEFIQTFYGKGSPVVKSEPLPALAPAAPAPNSAPAAPASAPNAANVPSVPSAPSAPIVPNVPNPPNAPSAPSAPNSAPIVPGAAPIVPGAQNAAPSMPSAPGATSNPPSLPNSPAPLPSDPTAPPSTAGPAAPGTSTSAEDKLHLCMRCIPVKLANGGQIPPGNGPILASIK